MAPRLFQKEESLTFQKMYGGICHLKWYRLTNFMDPAHGLNIFHLILLPCDDNFPLPGADIIKMTLGVMYDQIFIINIVICHAVPHRI